MPKGREKNQDFSFASLIFLNSNPLWRVNINSNPSTLLMTASPMTLQSINTYTCYTIYSIQLESQNIEQNIGYGQSFVCERERPGHGAAQSSQERTHQKLLEHIGQHQ